MQLPWLIDNALLIKLLSRDLSHAIEVIERHGESTRRSDRVWMQVVFETSFAGENCFAQITRVDAISCFLSVVRLRWEFVVVEVKLGQVQRRETVTPRPHMSATEGNKNQATAMLKLTKVRQRWIVAVQDCRDSAQKLDVVSAFDNE